MNGQITCGDLREVVPTLGTFDFVFADFPFNLGQAYAGYHDRRDDFEPFIFECVEMLWRACDGVLCLHGNDDLAELYLRTARRFDMKRIAWVNWHYRFGQCGRSKWVDAKCHCLVFSKHETWTWNSEAVLVDSDRVAYHDKRIHQTENGGKRLPGTVWGVPSDGPFWGRVQSNNAERQPGRPNQLPEVYIERLLKACTNVGDRVLDPCAGSGMTCVVADALARDWVAVDVDPYACEVIRQRVERGAVRAKPINKENCNAISKMQ